MFKNLQIFKFLDGINITIDDLQAYLERQTFSPCQKFSLESIGWVMPITSNEKLVHQVDDCLFFSFKKQERLLPAKVIKERLDERIAEIELAQNSKVRTREKRALKDDIIHELTPQAFVISSIINAYIDNANGWLVIDTPSIKKAEELVSFLRYTVGTLPVALFEFNDSISNTLTALVEYGSKENYCEPFKALDDCILLDNEGSKATCKQQDMFTDEVQTHIGAGKSVQRLKLEYDDSIQFSVDDKFAIKQIKFIGLIEEQINEVDAEDEYQQFLADNTIMTHGIKSLVKELIELFGEEVKLVSL